MGFALSTSWNASQCRDGRKLLFDIKEAGFKEIELSFNLTAQLVDEIGHLSREGGIRIISLHNYCPVPDGINWQAALPDYYALSSLDEDERRQAVKYTKITIDSAERLGARAVVLHCGRAGIADRTRQLIELYKDGQRESAGFVELRSDIIREREVSSLAFLNNSLRSLEELNFYAKKRGILLGIENRFYYREIPSLEEIKIILDKFEGSQIYYWHDAGHAQLMENLGFARHTDFLETGKDRLIGMHLHDIIGCQDHIAPGEGNLDFSILKPYLKADTLKVIEAHQPAALQALVKARELLAQIFDGRA